MKVNKENNKIIFIIVLSLVSDLGINVKITKPEASLSSSWVIVGRSVQAVGVRPLISRLC